MTIALKILNDQIKRISETNTLLDMLLEFEKVLDDVDLYAYKNWGQGEILEGPIVDRHFITVKLMYLNEDMPDPYGAKRLFAKDCLVKFSKDTLIRPIKVKSWDDVTTEARPDGSIKKKARSKSEPVWVVEIKMPRRFVDEFSSERIEIDNDNFVDLDSLDAEVQQEQEQDMMQTDPNMNMNMGMQQGTI
jgi:hypothetical protein